MTDTILPLHTVVAVVGGMERQALRAKRLPYALGMGTGQWLSVVNETMAALDLDKVPSAMCPKAPGHLGDFHGLPVLPIRTHGIALYTA